MRVVEVRAFGGVERLEDAERPMPVPGRGEVRIRIRAAGFNPVDYKWRQGPGGPPLPVVLGREVSGMVDAVGEGVTAFREGDAVFAYLGAQASNGGYAEALCVQEVLVAHKPASLSFAEAAAIPVASLTAYDSVVEKARVERGEAVFVAGAAGGVGSAAVGLLRHLGATPLLVTAGSDASAAYLVKELGVRPGDVVRYAGKGTEALAAELRERTGGWGVAAAFDFVGGAMKRLCFDTVAADGRVVSIVEEPPDYPLNLWDEDTSPLMVRSVSFHFVQLGARARLGPPSSWVSYGQRLAKLAALYETGALPRPRVERVGSLSSATARRAHTLLEEGHVRGKLVMEGAA
jgi:NADPH:quinone reductase-like Zn-dependent oxidoreductase